MQVRKLSAGELSPVTSEHVSNIHVTIVVENMSLMIIIVPEVLFD